MSRRIAPRGFCKWLTDEPSRVHLAVYNWDRAETVQLALSDVLKKGQEYSIRSVWDFFGEPVAKGLYDGKSVPLRMAGHQFEPEFGAYVLFKD